MNGEEIRELLARALWRIEVGPTAPPLVHAPASHRVFTRIATDLLPTVHTIVAAELRAMADEAQDHGTVDEDWAVSADRLEERADELEAGR